MNTREREQRFDARVTKMFERLYEAAVSAEITAAGGHDLLPEDFDRAYDSAQDRVSEEAIINIAIEMVLIEDYERRIARRVRPEALAMLDKCLKARR